MKIIFFTIITDMFVQVQVQVQAQELFQIPSSYEISGSVLPSKYLENYHINDDAEILSELDKKLLSCLLVNAASESKRIFNQTYYIRVKTPIISLFIVNYPKLLSHKWEGKTSGNGVISLPSIKNFIMDYKLCEKN
jgi:hypothetical protein